MVEDLATNQFVISEMLEKIGCSFEMAEDGEQGINMAKTNKYDLILMDCNMPVIDGFEATQKIRENGLTDIPIIALTAYALEGDQEKCLQAGMNDFISKPINKDLLIKILKKWTSKE